jgi:oligoribonuclease (3'-5' exoribonuclease)
VGISAKGRESGVKKREMEVCIDYLQIHISSTPSTICGNVET